MIDKFDLGDIVEMKKQHPCGSKEFEVIRLGADIKIKCVGCGPGDKGNGVPVGRRHDEPGIASRQWVHYICPQDIARRRWSWCRTATLCRQSHPGGRRRASIPPWRPLGQGPS